MKKYLVLVIYFLAFILAGCGDDSIIDDNNDSNTSYKGSTLHVFTANVKSCTPSIGSIAFVTDTSVLSTWTGWERNNSEGVLGKVFETTLERYESIYTQIAVLDAHIAKVNQFTDDFDTAGTYTIGTDTATVDTDVSSVEVPYLAWFFQELMSVPVDRVVTVTSGFLTIHMAFRTSGSKEVIVEQYSVGSTDAGVYYTVRDGDYRAVWHASVTDTTNSVQFTWDGTVDSDFRVSLCSDADGNWEVMGGGNVDSDSGIALMARNDDTNNSAKEWYTVMTITEFNNGTSKTPVDASVDAPDGTGAQKYITEDSGYCLGFYRTGDYPSTVDDLDWTN
jgi:hypothetical protein